MSMPIGRNPTPGNPSTTGGNYFGGPRGFAAGATSVLVNFILNYSKGNFEQLQRDIKGVQAAQSLNNQRTQAYLDRVSTLNKQIAAGQLQQLKLSATQLADYKDLLAIRQRANLEEKAYGRVSQQTTQELLKQEALLKAGLTSASTKFQFTKDEANALLALNDREAQLLADENSLNAARAQGVNLIREQTALQKAQGFAQQGISRLGALGIGLISGTIGGLLVSGALQPLQDALNNIITGLDKIIEPAKAASEALDAVNKELDDLAKNRDLSGAQAATELLKNLGLQVTQQNLSALTQAKTLKYAQDYLDAQRQTTDYLAGENQLHNDIGASIVRNRNALELQNRALQQGSFAADQIYNSIQILNTPGIKDLFNNATRLAGLPSLDQLLGINQGTINSAIDEADALQRVQENAAAAAQYIQNLNQENINTVVGRGFDYQINTANDQLDAFIAKANNAAEAAVSAINARADALVQRTQDAADARIKALQRQAQGIEATPSGRTKSLQAQLDALKDAEPSKRTQELADAIDNLTAAQARLQYQQQLADIDEQKHQILLKRRLDLTNAAIDLDKYQGQDRLIAIDALLERMRKQNEAQADFNKLLDIQYNIQRGVHREQGETIQDFIARRAQYYRGLLQQAAELRAKGPEADLEAEKERVQTSIQLKDLEEKKRKLIEDHARAQYLQSLQDQLAASKERDARELANRRDMLQKELEASRKADQDRAEHERQAIQERIDRIRQDTQDRIEQINKQRAADVDAVNNARDHSIEAAQRVTDNLIKQLQVRADQAKQWANFANIQSLNTAIQGSSTMAQLQALSGQVSGLSWTMNYLQQTGYWMGLDPNARDSLLRSYTNVMRDYMNKIVSLHKNATPPAPPHVGGGAGGGFAEGGMWIANNSNTPLGRDIRWGDGNGDELGIMLNNKVLRELRQQSNQRAFGDINIQTIEDPYAARAAWRREVRNVVREEMR